MSSKNESTASGGIGLGGIIFVLFMALKLIGIAPVATWSWWWVTAPLWGATALVLVILAAIGIGAGVYAVLTK